MACYGVSSHVRQDRSPRHQPSPRRRLVADSLQPLAGGLAVLSLQLRREFDSRRGGRALEQLLRVRAAHFALRISAKHASDLIDSACPLENGNVGSGDASFGALGYHDVMVRASGDLR